MWSQAKVPIPLGIDTQEAQYALEFYTDLVKENNVWRADFPEATTAFVNGQVSMIFVPSWQLVDILEADPSMNLGVAPIPQAIPEEPVTWGSFWMFAVPTNSDAKAQAWKFISYLTSEESQQKIHEEASKIRAFGAPYVRVNLAQSLASDEFFGPIIESAQYATSAEVASRAGNRRQVEALTEAVNRVLLEDADPAEALRDAKAKIMGN
jgi:ABC-type glycerol-3-phosphate transport system substrate-binding protein